MIQHNNIGKNERTKINLILLYAYENFSIKKAIEFKNRHKYKCKDIRNEELFFYSKIGLFKAIQNYNGNNSLANYSYLYIHSELLKLITDKYSLSIIPKSYRIKNKCHFPKRELYNYKKLLDPKLACRYETWQFETMFYNHSDDILHALNNKYEHNEKINTLMEKLTPSMKRIVYLKYLNESKQISNKKISVLMGCSEETVRKQINKIKKIAANMT
jgi:RNA polymerase sigma factor (sigma-70 family)